MTPFEGVGLGHGDESKQTQSLTLPSAAPVFATQPRDVPIFLFEQDTPFNIEQNRNSVEQDRNFDQLVPSFNYLVAEESLPPQQPDYVLQKCWGTTCLYKRPGSCASIPGYHVNQVLKRRGE